MSTKFDSRYRKSTRNRKFIVFKKKRVFNTIKNVTILFSLFVNIVLVLAFIAILTNNFSVIIDKNCFATTSENVLMTMPVTFYLDASTKIKGYASASIPKGTKMPVKITLSKPRITAKLFK
jgi:hypothetical protein